MEIIYIILAFILGVVLAYFILKSSSVSRKSYEELQQNFNQKEADFNKIIAEISAQNKAQLQKIAEQQELNERQNSEIKDLQNDKNQLTMRPASDYGHELTHKKHEGGHENELNQKCTLKIHV